MLRVAKYRIATENMIDAYGVLATELAEKLLAEKIFLSPNPNHDYVKRVLTHVVSNDKPPSEVKTVYQEKKLIYVQCILLISRLPVFINSFY